MDNITQAMLQSDQPAVRLKALLHLKGAAPDSTEAKLAQGEMVSSALVKTLLEERGQDGKLPHHPYNKWVGAHWVLASLADLAYPSGDAALRPMLDQSYAWLLSEGHWKNIREIAGRTRRCASQEGNCIYYSVALGLADERTQELAERLLRWQWPDGGWNCDKRPEARISSFHETLTPLRGLVWYARLSGDPAVARVVEQAAELFLRRQLFLGLRSGQVMDEAFVKLHYPSYWHYDVLSGLKIMAEAGFIHDPRCQKAIEWLQSRQLPDGGFPAEAKFYRTSNPGVSGYSRVNWGGISGRKRNDFVTVDALWVLSLAG